MPKNKKCRSRSVSRCAEDRNVRHMVAVYMHGQSFQTKPLCYISREERDWWIREGSGAMREAPGCAFDRGRVFELSKATSIRLQTGNSALGECLIWAVLQRDEEALAKLNVLRYRSTADHNRVAAA